MVDPNTEEVLSDFERRGKLRMILDPLFITRYLYDHQARPRANVWGISQHHTMRG